MTPKEKAKELINKYFDVIPHRHTSRKLAKKCAIIAVEEIMEATQKFTLKGKSHPIYVYYEEVKQEIEKL